ncbi:unnamed protein product [Camellia sinensis]
MGFVRALTSITTHPSFPNPTLKTLKIRWREYSGSNSDNHLMTYTSPAMTMSESFSGNYNFMRQEEYNNKSSEEVHNFDGVFNLEEIGLVR